MAGDEPEIFVCKYPKILCYGDSLTQGGSDKPNGWVNILQRTFLRRIEIYNRGLSGWTSKWCDKYTIPICNEVLGLSPMGTNPPNFYSLKERGRQISSKDGHGILGVPNHNAPQRGACGDSYSTLNNLWGLDGEGFLASTVWLGANDATLPGIRGKELYAVPVEEYMGYMRNICTKILDTYTDILIIISPPCIHQPNRRKFALQLVNGDESKIVVDRTDEHSKKYADACREVYNEMLKRYEGQKRIFYVDTHELFWEKREELLHDGLHFTEEGDKIVAEEILKALRTVGIYCEMDPLRGQHGNSGSKSHLLPPIPFHDERAKLNW